MTIPSGVTAASIASAKSLKCITVLNCNVFTHRTLRSSCVRAFQIELEFGSVGF